MKSGLEYFPLEVVDDLKLRLLKSELGVKGFGVLVELWRYIYREDGYFGKWNEDVESLFAFETGAGRDFVSEVVKAAVRRDIFDKGMFEKYGILTSRGIQKRYLEGVSRRVSVNLEKSYLLIDISENLKNVNISGENVDRNDENVNIFAQSKVKESKVKKSKVYKGIVDGETPPDTPAEKRRFMPPTVDEVRAYCEERKNNVDPEKFVDHYAANGWRVGKTPMRDWRAAVRTWERNEFSERKNATPAPSENSTFDTDEFFEAALKRSYENIGKKRKTDADDLVRELKEKFTEAKDESDTEIPRG